ncbi:hypothetical protein [Cystobacter fuscus]|uniref:hypothetical protein n=1 Tax=Cystobacter fuscus TaxID=43 RepID=UPI0012DF6ACE|nr:hypothetical protein [Cystobacter fuscus]
MPGRGSRQSRHEASTPKPGGSRREVAQCPRMPFARGLPGRAVVSARFVHFVERHALKNMLLLPTEDYIWDPLELGPPRLTP